MNAKLITIATSVLYVISLQQILVTALPQSQEPAHSVNTPFLENSHIKKSKTFCNLMLALHFPQTGCEMATQQPDKKDNNRKEQSNTKQSQESFVLIYIIPFINNSSALLANASAALASIGTEISKDKKSKYLII